MKKTISSKSILSLIMMMSFLIAAPATKLWAQTTQTIKGRLLDQESKQPIIGATVTVFNGTLISGTTTDADGFFKIEKIPLGRKTIKITYIGYEPLTVPDIMVTAGKEVVLNLMLAESVTQMKEVVVTYSRKNDRNATNNEMATVSARSFNPDDTKKFAGALGDPSRMAANFAGVVSGNDSRNDIVVRGNSPNAMLWQLEGVNIFNPNHFGSNFNTGGPVSMINANNIAKSDFFTGAFPAQYGNAIGGVFDLNLREGNNEKREYIAQVGFNGFELGAEGPFSKKSKASYMFNYRYSTIGLMKAAGVNVGTGAAIPLYQDMNYKISVPLKNKSKLSFFGMGGISSIDLLARDVDTNGINFYGDLSLNQYPRYQKLMNGVSYEKNISEKTWAKLTLAAAYTNDKYSTDSLNLRNETAKWRKAEGNFIDQKYSAVFNLTHKFNAKNALHAGVTNDYTYFDYSNHDYYNMGMIDSLRVNRKGTVNLLQAYAQWKHRFTARLSANMGVHTQYFSTNNEVVLEPRLGVRYAFSDKNSMNVGYGMHHQTLPIYNLFAQDAAGNAPNKSLEFTRANHIVLGYDQMITRSMKLRIETYYQWLDKVPVHTYASSYSVLNLGASFNPSDEVNLTNTGKGTNYGVELTLEQYFTKGFYFLITGSLFESKYKGSDGIERNTAFNSNYACNVLAGKEFKVSKKGSIVYLNLKFTTLGGRYFTPVDLAASGVARRAIYDNALAFTEKQSAYIRGDMKVGYRKDFVHSSLEFAVDFQNITNHQNIFAIGYNARTNSIGKQYQQGFFPVPMFRFTF